jgi:hypothetical protein
MTDFQALYREAVDVSNAAEAFEDLVDFETTTMFVEKIQAAQKKFVEHVCSAVEEKVISAAASGAKHTEIFTFQGADLFEGFNILFMLFGGVEQERRDQLAQFGFKGCFEELMQTVSPFYLKHTWLRSMNENMITLHWE